jgi:hypothetical protein
MLRARITERQFAGANMAAALYAFAQSAQSTAYDRSAQHFPSCALGMRYARRKQSLEYVLPLHPQTG